MDIYTYTDLPEIVTRYVGRAAQHPVTHRPVLLADIEGRYGTIDLGTGHADIPATTGWLQTLDTWTWYPHAIVVLDGIDLPSHADIQTHGAPTEGVGV